MSGIFGALDINNTERGFMATVGQTVVFDMIDAWLQQYNADMMAAMSVFIEETTEGFKERYKLPGGGRLQRRGGKAQSGATKATGSFDVAFPLEEFGAQVSGGRVPMAYMSARELENHISTVAIQNTNTVRWEILHRLFDNVQSTFTDEIHGSLSIEPLANNDSVTYPPVLGSESEAAENHYYGLNYTAANISDTNNPLKTLRDELEEHFGNSTGGENIVVFCNNAQTTQLKSLTDFDPVVDRFIRAGDNVDVPVNLPAVPGIILGRGSGVWVAEWRWVPANYLLAIHLDVPAPLKMRVDPADTGLPRGLTLVAEDEDYPFKSSHWENRFGVGAGNRLNGVCAYLVASATYTIPTAYD